MKLYDFISARKVAGLTPVMKNGLWGLVRSDDYTKEFVALEWDAEPEEVKGYISVIKNGKKGLYNGSGHEILPAIYEQIFVPKDTIIIAYRVDGRCALLDKEGVEIIPFKDRYTALEYNNDEQIIAYKNGKGGVITISKKEVIPFIYDTISEVTENRFYVEKDGLWGLIDFSGKEIFPCEYDNLYITEEAIISCKKGKYNLHTVNGKEYLEFSRFEFLNFANENKFVARQGKLYGIVDKMGTLLTEYAYQSIRPFKDGIAVACDKNGKWGIIDSNGAHLCKFEYDEVCHFVHGMSLVRVGDKWGYINITGKLVVPTIYDDCYDFLKYGYARVCRDGKWTIVNKLGEEILPCIYDKIEPLETGDVKVVFDGKKGMVKL